MSNEVIITHNDHTYKIAEIDWNDIPKTDKIKFVRSFRAITGAYLKDASEIWDGINNGSIVIKFVAKRDLAEIIEELTSRVREVGLTVEIIIK